MTPTISIVELTEHARHIQTRRRNLLYDVISYMEMCSAVGVNLQRGMNFRLLENESVILMSVRPGAPYADRVEEDGRVLIYEGHDCAKTAETPYPKQLDQPERNRSGSLTQNGLFAESMQGYKQGQSNPEIVHVYQKIKDGIWVYNGRFELIDCWTETDAGRRVFKFELRLTSAKEDSKLVTVKVTPTDDRLIPSWVKLEVWKRDAGKCRECGANTHLHFDHIIPYSKGGSSRDPANIQILCARHNLAKHDSIQ